MSSDSPTYLRYRPYTDVTEEDLDGNQPSFISIKRRSAVPVAPPNSLRSSEATQESNEESYSEEYPVEAEAMSNNRNLQHDTAAPGLVSYAEAVRETGDSGVSPADQLLKHRPNGVATMNQQTSSKKPTSSAHDVSLTGTDILEKEVREYDGNYLTSTKMPDEYKYALDQNMQEDKRIAAKAKKAKKDELASGRQAGAGWHTSA